MMHCAIWYQTLKHGVRMVGQNAILTSYNAFECLSQESISLSVCMAFKPLSDI